ncbi:penicillin-binding transpeptidase domain-containing protein [Indiicoccus explosivorum]|uniref:penicillin-binding transpeptidase domain-containing protein n=1 Tax=Indiicoccus explosivorum TaxID=1917864 RepID=UPI000B438F2D|nr:penicillin-binding transpeptidase domain-containing protein [Indiicoccus explosivorum]
MDKRLACLLPLLLMTAACQESAEPEEQPAPEEPAEPEVGDPEERAAAYIEHWNAMEYSVMYEDFVSSATAEAFGEEQFVARQQQLKEKLGIHDMAITYTAPPEETAWENEEFADFPIHVSMETVAGPIEFDETLTLVREEQDGEEGWFVDWGPSLILPSLETGDTVEVEITESAARGEITDRAGRAIAANTTGYEIGIVPGQFTDPALKPELADLIGVTVAHIDSRLNQSWVQPDFLVPIATLPANEAGDAELADTMPGVAVNEATVRSYPYGEALSHVTGYIAEITAEQLETMKEDGYAAGDVVGRKGLELLLQERLRGKDGARIYIEKTFGEQTEQVTVAERPAEPGETVQLSIDAKLQQRIYAAMNGEAGASAAIDPKTGDTLALVSSPGFDPNLFVNGITQSQFQELQNNPKNPLFNRFTARYAPGSTIKPVTAAIGLEAGTIDPAAGVEINDETWRPDSSWGNYEVTRVHPEVPNPINLNKALVYSDNIYFAMQALEMGEETFVEGLKAYGFGEETPFPFDIRPSQISNSGELAGDIQLANTSFGQGEMLVNIVHLASMYEAFLNNGLMYEPALFLEEDPAAWKEGLVSEKNAELIRTSLRNVVEEGPLTEVKQSPVPLAGKTGTAELKGAGEEDGKQNGFFVGYDTAQPSMILAMMIEGVEDNNGSAYPAKLAADIFANTAN